MSDLKCIRCGIERSYADASIEDIRKTCERTRESQHGTYTAASKHDWVEA